MPTVLTLDGINLPPSLIWIDRNSWSPIQQTSERVLGGREVTEYAALIAGQPITLQGERTQGWVNWALFLQLQSRAHVAGAVYDLQIGDNTWQVMFRHEDPPALDWEPIIKRLTPGNADVGLLTLKLKTV